jgi:ABC-type transport system involved in cytochrome c biogenesis ATPase subunit
MLQISLHSASKRYNKDWIFKDLTYTFDMGNHYAFIGNNGSGKSTLLQCVAGYISLSKGTIKWGDYDTNNIYKQISIAAPYLELIEEFTTIEQFKFHTQFKPLIKDISVEQIIEMIGLKDSSHKQIRYFSSGMKQRLKLALAIFADAPILLLDEPCSNLDLDGYALYHMLIQKYARQQIEKSNLLAMLPGGIVLTGGGAQLAGTDKLFEDIFKIRVRVAEPDLGAKFPKIPGLAASVGLARFTIQCQEDISPVGGVGGWTEKFRGLLGIR